MTPDYDKLFNELQTTDSEWIVAVKREGKSWLKVASKPTENEAVQLVSDKMKREIKNLTRTPTAFMQSERL